MGILPFVSLASSVRQHHLKLQVHIIAQVNGSRHRRGLYKDIEQTKIKSVIKIYIYIYMYI